jgi:hypothetical protein
MLAGKNPDPQSDARRLNDSSVNHVSVRFFLRINVVSFDVSQCLE